MIVSRSKKVRWLVDCDSFFANCERLLHPELAWCPLCVWGDIVIAASYDLKVLGIRIWTPVWEAKKIAPPSTIFLPPRLGEYRKISSRLMEYLRSKALDIQVFSIDEAFVEFTWYDDIFSMDFAKMMVLLQQDVLRKIGIPISIWLAPTKILAKMFASLHKPYGVFVGLDEQVIDTVLQQVEYGDIPFIGRKTQKKIAHLCTTAYDFKGLPYGRVKQELGAGWLKLRFELNQCNALTLWRTGSLPKSIWRSYSFNPHFTYHKEEVWKHLLHNIEKLLMQLKLYECRTSCISLSFRDKWFKRFWAKKRLASPTRKRHQFISLCRKMFDTMPFGEWILYRSTWVHCTDIVDGKVTQSSLFDTKASQSRALDTVIHTLNQKLWPWTIRSWSG